MAAKNSSTSSLFEPSKREAALPDAVGAWLANKQREAYEVALVVPDGLRTIGLQRLDQALLLIKEAFNVENRVECPYTFDDQVRLRASQLIMDVFELWKANSKSMRITSGGLAAASPEFQRVMAQLVTKSSPQKRRGKGKRDLKARAARVEQS